VLVTVRYQLGLLQPCVLVILNCNFNTALTVDWLDALDLPSTEHASLPAKAPNLPPVN
jgi:hypothetical protein